MTCNQHRGHSREDRYVDRGDILLRVIAAAYLGIFVTCCILPLWTFGSHRIPSTEGAFGPLISVVGHLVAGVSLYPYAVVVTLPLVVFACAVAVIFRNSIQRHVVLWCAAAPFVIWLAALAILGLIGVFDGAQIFSPRSWNAALSEPSLLFLFGPIPSSAIFYWIWRRAEADAVGFSG